MAKGELPATNYSNTMFFFIFLFGLLQYILLSVYNLFVSLFNMF